MDISGIELRDGSSNNTLNNQNSQFIYSFANMLYTVRILDVTRFCFCISMGLQTVYCCGT